MIDIFNEFIFVIDAHDYLIRFYDLSGTLFDED